MLILKKTLIVTLIIINKFLLFFRFQLVNHRWDLDNLELINEFLNSIRPVNHIKDLIRIGSDYDGGYLLPNELEGINYCYSAGVSDNSDFESHLTTYGIKCFLTDYSVDGPAKENPLFRFSKKFLGNKIDLKSIRLDTWIQQNESDDQMLLKMDIEGAEYEVILNTPFDVLTKFRILVIEFHDFNMLNQKHSHSLISSTFYKLLRYFKVIHVHANNCCKSVKIAGDEIPQIMEFTFLRNDYFIESDLIIKFPHKLDEKNIPSKKEVNLPKSFSK